jgi:EamA domain-containing membrane protein RarD
MMIIVFAFLIAFMYADYKLVRDFLTTDAYGRLICGVLILIITALAVLDLLVIEWWVSCGGITECVR